MVLIVGLGMVAGMYYFDHVALPEDISMEQTTTIYYADGTTPLGGNLQDEVSARHGEDEVRRPCG